MLVMLTEMLIAYANRYVPCQVAANQDIYNIDMTAS